MIDFFKRLDIYMKYKGLNDNRITVEAGISNGLIGKGRKRGSLSQDNISKILYAYSDLSADWLLTGKGEMLKNHMPKDTDAEKNKFLIAYLQEKDRKIEELLRENARLQMELESAKNSSTASSNVNSKHVG